MILADKIVSLRKKAGWSQEDLAEKLGVTRQSVSKWEGAQSVPDMDKVVMMSRLFGVSTDFLLKDELEEETPCAAAQDDDTPLRRVSLTQASAYLAQPIAAYSHGMKQKLSIIAAWLHDPKVIIMDEPFVGLDPKAAHLLKGMMREVCDNGGAIFFSTHVLEVAEKLCDKVAIIKGGRLIRSGTMEEVKGDDSLEEVFLELEAE